MSGLMLAGTGVLSESLVTCVLVLPFFFGCVVRTFDFRFFSLPLDVAGNIAKYLFTIFGEFKHVIPCSWLLFAVSLISWMGLKSDWCMYFSCWCLYGWVYHCLATLCASRTLACRRVAYNVVAAGLCNVRPKPSNMLFFETGLIGSCRISVFLSQPPHDEFVFIIHSTL